MNSRLSGYVGSLVMFFFGATSLYRFYSSGLIFFLLMMFRDFLAAWLLIKRNDRLNEKNNNWFSLISYVSSAMPLFYFKNSYHNPTVVIICSLLAIIGFSLSTFALIELGKSFGVSPANRGAVSSGIYRFMSHPMYTGYVISESGFILFNPMNIIIFIFSFALYLIRARIEINYLSFRDN